jgi:hypothetical protein
VSFGSSSDPLKRSAGREFQALIGSDLEVKLRGLDLHSCVSSPKRSNETHKREEERRAAECCRNVLHDAFFLLETHSN